MEKKFICEICEMSYKTQNGLLKHNRLNHKNNDNNKPKKYPCEYCDKEYNSRQNRWVHMLKCKEVNKQKISLEEKVNQLTEKVNTLEKKPQKIINNNTTNNNTTNNIQYVINSPEVSSIGHLTFELQKDILDKGLNSLVYLIEMINFNKSVPENHSYCITAINDKHASVIDEKTNTIIKTNKSDLFDKVLGANLSNLEKIATNPKFTPAEKAEYAGKIEYLKKSMFQNNKFIKRYQSDINLMSYNKKDMVQETWKYLKPVEENLEEEQMKGFDDLIAELPDAEKPDWLKPKSKLINISDSEDSDDSELSLDSELDDENEEIPDIVEIEIKIKNKSYIIKGSNVYDKMSGEYYGIYIDGKVKRKIKHNDIEV
jgi:hypothetical protein